jgi:hypothetical protein
MSSAEHGTNTSVNEVTSIERFGFWVIVDDGEYFIPFSEYPVFKKANVEQLFLVQRLSPDQLHWPALDADVELDALKEPDRFPLVWHEDETRYAKDG